VVEKKKLLPGSRDKALLSLEPPFAFVGERKTTPKPTHHLGPPCALVVEGKATQAVIPAYAGIQNKIGLLSLLSKAIRLKKALAH
jgi:hypothetical protein